MLDMVEDMKPILVAFLAFAMMLLAGCIKTELDESQIKIKEVCESSGGSYSYPPSIPTSEKWWRGCQCPANTTFYKDLGCSDV